MRAMRRVHGVTLLVILILGAFPVVPAAAATTFEVLVGPRLSVKGVEYVTYNEFLPNALTVHPGDTIRFTSDMFHTVTLLPANADPEEWTQANSKPMATDAYSFLMPDPDEGEDMWKASTPAAVGSRFDCGAAGQPPCEFSGEGPSLGWNMDDVLNSGLPATGPLDFSVIITADPGTTIWALCLVHQFRMRMPIRVVDTAEATSDPAAIERSVSTTLSRATRLATKLDAEYSSKSVKRRLPGGGFLHEAWAGLDRGPLSLIDLYPHTLNLKQGDRVRWTFPQRKTGSEDHTVSGPIEEAIEIANSFPQLVCDVDTDEGPLPDAEALPLPPFCPGFVYQLEVDLPAGFVPELGDGTFKGGLTSSGIRGANMVNEAPWELSFGSLTPSAGTDFICIVHPFMRTKVFVR